MDDYISKPVDKQLLLRVLDKWLPELADTTAAGGSTEASGPQVSQVLDTDTLAQLAQDTSPQMLPRMLEAFRKEAISRVQAISQQHSPPELEQLGREAHSLKSSAGTFGAFDLQQLALELEVACRNGQAAVAEQAARKIQQEWDRVRVALDQYLADASTAKTAAS
jgi:HPt (histidine-containing phosphotransfer) domain-containing protein